jgi:hypothetical protein
MAEKWVVVFYSDRQGREPVRAWIDELERTAPTEYGTVRHQIDLLQEFGPLLSEAHTKELRGKLRRAETAMEEWLARLRKRRG